MIQLIFTNGTQSVELKNIRSVEWQTEASENTFVDTETRVGKRTRSITINGFINKGVFVDNVKAQQLLENQLRAVGNGKIQYTGATDIENARFLSLKFDEFRGNPIAPFTIEFRTEEENPHAHYTVKLGDLILAPTYGYDYPTIKESQSSQGSDESITAGRKKVITIEGSFVGATRDEINVKQQELVDEITGLSVLVLTLSTNSGVYSSIQNVRPTKLEFSAPAFKGEVQARKYVFECTTYDDYTKEPYTLGEVATAFAGITIDVVETVDNNKEFEKSSTGPETLVNEDLNVSGKKYFTSYSSYETFRNSFNPIPANTYSYTSGSSNVLLLTDISIGKFERDGNYADLSKRYSSSITLTFKWQKTVEDNNLEALTSRFGISFYKIPSITLNCQVDNFGNVVSRSISLNGEVKNASQLGGIKALVGTQISYDAPYVNMYVTSVNIGDVTVINDGGSQIKLYKISITASQLEISQQAVSFLQSLFRLDRAGATGTSYSGETILLSNITSYSKSISNRYNQQQLKFTVTSISLSLSGEVFDADNGGKPQNPNKIVNIFDKIDALLTAPLSVQSGANVVPVGEALPSNPDIGYFLNNFNASGWTPAVAPENLPGFSSKGSRYWKQTVSLSVTAVFDLAASSGGTEPVSTETKSIEFAKESPRFTQIQVANFGTVFKRIGTNPEKATVTYEKRFRDASVYVPNDYGADDTVPTGWAGLNDSVITRDGREQRNLVNRHTVERTATKQLNP